MSPRTSQQYEQIRAKSKKKIFQAAVELFSSQGYHVVSVSQIADKAGVAKGLIYNYFESKDAILQEIIHQVSSEMIGFMSAMEDEKEPKKRLETLIRSTFKLLKEKKDFYSLIMPLLSQPSFSKEVKQSLASFIKVIVQDMEVSLSNLNVQYPRIEALTIGAMIDGIAWHYLLIYKEKYPLDEMELKVIAYIRQLP